MKTGKIISLILAMLMVLTILPMTFVSVLAEDVDASAPTELIENIAEHKYGDWEQYDADQHKAVCECGDVVYEDHEWLPAPGAGCGDMCQYSCFDCGATKNELMKGEHAVAPESPYWKSDADGHLRNCQNCANRLYEAHTWDDGVVTTEPTATEDGIKTYTCACGEIKTETIPATGAPATDDKPADDKPADDAEAPGPVEKVTNKVTSLLGCSSTISGGAGLMMLLSGAAVMLIRKKKED